MPNPALPHRPTNWTGVLFGFLLAVLAAFQQFKLPPMLPDLLAAYDYPITVAGGFMSIYAVIGLVVSLGLGTLLARLGTLPILMAAFATAIAGNILALTIPENVWAMLGSRALEGLAFAVFAIAGPVYSTRNAGPHHLSLAIAMSAIWIPIGQITANLLVPVAEATIGWRLLWLATAGATLLMAAWVVVIRVNRGRAMLDLRTQPDAVALPLSGEERWALALAALIFTLWSAQYFAYMTWLPQFLVQQHGLDQNLATLGYSVPVVILIVVGLFTSRVIRRGAAVGPLLVGSLILQAGVWWALPVTTGLEMGVVSLLVYGIGIGITPVCLFALPSTILGSTRTGPKAFAAIMTGRNLGVLIGPVLLPQVLLLTGVWSASGPVFGAITTLDLIGAVFLTIGLARMGRRGPT
ncbi:MAG: MFS transporter [Alphaproteobacteria bacterium]|nr:MFS transporter [Alphaproteobacteria bacterium]